MSASFWSRLGTVSNSLAPFTNEKYRPSPGSTIWLVLPIVVPPPPCPVLTVWPLVMLTPSDWLAGCSAVTTMATSPAAGVPSPKVRNRFWPEGAPCSEKSLRVPTLTYSGSARILASS